MNLQSRGRSRIMLTVDSARCGVVSGRIEWSGIAPTGVKLGFVPSIGGVYPPDLPARIRVFCVPARSRWSSLRFSRRGDSADAPSIARSRHDRRVLEIR